jgi:1,4-alpha-glucan branching enzyme
MKTLANVINHPTFITDYDIYLFKQGSNNNLYNKLGSHLLELNGVKGTHFAVWAPNAEYVSVIGDFNGWNKESHPLSVRWDESGIWEGFIPNLGENTLYKYNIVSKVNNYKVEKGDPFAFKWETPPKTASIVRELKYEWNDAQWLKNREKHNSLNSPMSTYELHIGSWKRIPEQGNRSLNYRELAVELAQYLREMGFTHVEFMPVMEHPFYGSWGYQTTGYFAPTSRYGSPQDFMYLVDYLHQHDIGVILDWVPSHFPGDEFGLHFFDGTHLYEHEDKRKGYHPDWDSYIFNYGRNEVKSFLISSAQFWLDKYHIDALRVDAVASMLYLDYSRNDGEWIPNEHGGNENLEAINLIRELNKSTYTTYPGIQTIAEESTAWPMVSKPTDVGGLGFGMKWNMGWMNDTLKYFEKDPIHRKYYHNMLTFSMIYAFNENFVLSLSHDEVVYGKGSLFNKMPGDEWQKASNLRALYGYMFGHPGKKLLFMGGEFGQWSEWDHERSLDWHLLGNPLNAGIQKWVSDLNSFYKDQPALYEIDFSSEGFEWRNVDDNESSVISFIRKSNKDSDVILVVCNFTPVVRESYKIHVPTRGYWRECLNSDALIYGGSGVGNGGGVETKTDANGGGNNYIDICLPPLGVLFLKFEPKVA